MLDSATLTALGISGFGLALSIGSVAVGYGATKTKAESATEAVKDLDGRLDKRLERMERDIKGISREVSTMRGELNERNRE